jgi:hypothetical protein
MKKKEAKKKSEIKEVKIAKEFSILHRNHWRKKVTKLTKIIYLFDGRKFTKAC